MTAKDGEISLGTIKNQSFNNIHILHNFTLEESANNNSFDILGEGTKITSVYPLIFEFNKEKRDNVIVILKQNILID